jgi:ferric-dicitrate binding protein FerR (iron transport regulator)
MEKTIHPMTNLLKKYAAGTLSTKELVELRHRINQTGDSELAGPLEELWSVETGNSAPSETLNSVKKEVDARITHLRFRKRRIIALRGAITAAAVVVLAIALNLLYIAGQKLPVSDMIVSVGAGEKVNVVLPDGTKVSLNSESTLNYNTSTFNKRLREVSLVGEAWFDVTRSERPFIIATALLGVEVLGTSFNLRARDEERTVEINLIEGKVMLTPTNDRDNNSVLYPNQKAVLDKNTGKITISRADTDQATAWKRGELAFKATHLGKVLREIERSYGVTIETDMQNGVMDDPFTGTFPAKDLDRTLALLAMHYKFTYTIDGNTVTIYK